MAAARAASAASRRRSRRSPLHDRRSQLRREWFPRRGSFMASSMARDLVSRLAPATKKPSAGCSASRPATGPGLFYRIARVLARHRINLQLAKVSTLGERVEDTFLIDGPELQHNKAQIAIETELLEALNT